MAIWQVYVDLINAKQNGLLYYSEINDSLSEIKNFLPETKSWCTNTIQFGDLESTCLEIYVHDSGVIESICLRLDLRYIEKEHLIVLSKFLLKHNIFIKYHDCLCESTLEVFFLIINESAANRFIKDPEQFFLELSDKSEDS